MDKLLKEVLMIDELSIVETDKVNHTVEMDMLKLVVKVECFGKCVDEFDKVTVLFGEMQLKQEDRSYIHASNELHLHVVHIVPRALENDIMLWISQSVEWLLRARQACFSAEVRLRSEHNNRERKKFERKCQRQVDLLKEKDTEIANLKAQLFLKEAGATEAIRLSSQVVAIKGTEAARVNRLRSLKGQNATLKGQVAALEFATAIKDTELASSNTQITKLTQDLSNFQLSCDELCVKAASFEYEKDKLID
ncbi:hypothetical protein Tco_0653441 [Tanacetum coccineum]|uniref:Uncharacterized protein n=1 Tax=Tanacetum coccineum TaxID=301880 RepID=A0ABQ4X0K9_9ASTR